MRPLLLVLELVFSRLVPLRTSSEQRTCGPPPSLPSLVLPLGPSCVLFLLSNVLSPSEVDRLRKLAPAVEPSDDQLAMELAANMQHQEQLKKQVGVLQQRVIDAETKLLKRKELLGETERSVG